MIGKFRGLCIAYEGTKILELGGYKLNTSSELSYCLHFSGWIRPFLSSLYFSKKKTFFSPKKLWKSGRPPRMVNSITYNIFLLKPSIRCYRETEPFVIP